MFNNLKTNTTNYLKNFFLNMNPAIILTAIDFISIIHDSIYLNDITHVFGVLYEIHICLL